MTTQSSKLSWKHFPAGEAGFFRAPVLITGPSEALLIDGGFTFDDGRALVEAIKASGKHLTAIYISQSDPDYYFSLAPIKKAFPEARVIAASATVDAIKASVDSKLAIWGPQLKEHGPQTLANIVMPEPYDEATLTVDGEAIEIVDANGMPNRRYLWSPNLRAVFGGVLIFSGVHVWTADTKNAEQRAAWRDNLVAIAACAPAIVVPGHMATGANTDASAIAHTKAWLEAFEQELPKAKDAAALIEAIKARYPNLGMEVAIDIGAKVAKGEMAWG